MVESTSTIGSRQRAAAIASPSRVCAFSRTSSASSSACQVARSTTTGIPGVSVAPPAGHPTSFDSSFMIDSMRHVPTSPSKESDHNQLGNLSPIHPTLLVTWAAELNG